MKTLAEIRKKYQGKLDSLDLELIVADIIKKSREFVLTYPEYKITSTRNSQLTTLIERRIKREPIAYILGHKEFFGLDFKVDKNTLIPRPETELLVELAIHLVTHNPQPTTIIDVGTGSGNIIISLVKNLLRSELRPACNDVATSGRVTGYEFIGIDISKKTLNIAKKNAKTHKIDKKIKFLRGNLLEPLIKSSRLMANSSLIVIANLPYLSSKIYSSAPIDVKKYEPKSALLSGTDGLNHYKKLFKQLKKIVTSYDPPATMLQLRAGLRVTSFLEISPEQKPALQKIIKSSFSKAEFEFKKDLAGKWRICIIHIIA
jgi:release factor glutamine methyltransferase